MVDYFCGLCAEKKEYLSNICSLKVNVLEWISKIINLDENLIKTVCYSCLKDIQIVNSIVAKWRKSFEYLSNSKFETEEGDHSAADYPDELKIEDNSASNPEWLEDSINYVIEDIDADDNSLQTNQINKTNLKTNTEYSRYHFKCKFCDFKCNGRYVCAHHMRKEHFRDNKNIFIKEIAKLAVFLNNENLTGNSFNAENIENEETLIQNLINLPEIFECTICNIKFDKKFSLKVHNNRVHSKEKELKKHKKQYLCTECGDTYTSIFGFKYHALKHEKKNLNCQFCQKLFGSEVLLSNHMRIHTGGMHKKYPCNICNKMFKSPSDVKVHLRFHLNDKPFKCDYCEKTYAVKSHVTQHMKTHTGLRDNICTAEGCIKSYFSASDLQKHYFECHVPDSQKEFGCQFCERRYARPAYLRDHYRKSHRKLALEHNLI